MSTHTHIYVEGVLPHLPPLDFVLVSCVFLFFFCVSPPQWKAFESDAGAEENLFLLPAGLLRESKSLLSFEYAADIANIIVWHNGGFRRLCIAHHLLICANYWAVDKTGRCRRWREHWGEKGLISIRCRLSAAFGRDVHTLYFRSLMRRLNGSKRRRCTANTRRSLSKYDTMFVLLTEKQRQPQSL